MSLQAGNDLELVFDIAQEEVGLGQVACASGWQVTEFGESLQRFDSFLGADAAITASIDQAKRLHNEFELADSAVSEFDVALDQIGRAKFHLDLMLHGAQLAQRVEIEIAA